MIEWVQQTLNDPECYVRSASSDASFRSYWRVFSQMTTYIVMDAPPTHEDCRPFISVAEKLLATGVNAPAIHAQNLEQGFLLLSDLGTVPYLNVLNNETQHTLYTKAIDALLIMQSKTNLDELPNYNEALLMQELQLFDQWFIGQHLGIELTVAQRDTWNTICATLVNNALQQPQTFVHRDYHSRNLMKTVDNNPGIIDFQDAVVGPFTYDLVSLLKDCYISWDDDIVDQHLSYFLQHFNEITQHNIEYEQCRRWFDLMGTQRHLKAIGIFCRLNYRDNKPGYLKDINRTLNYIKQVAEQYSDLHHFLSMIDDIQPHMEQLCEP